MTKKIRTLEEFRDYLRDLASTHPIYLPIYGTFEEVWESYIWGLRIFFLVSLALGSALTLLVQGILKLIGG